MHAGTLHCSAGAAPYAVTRLAIVALILFTLVGCGTVLKKEYEYEEELYLALDGSATLNVNASIPALVALRGVDLDVDPRARVDRAKVRALFEGPGAQVDRVSTSRRNGRRFVHISVEVSDVRHLQRLAPFAWSTYKFDRQGDVIEFRQLVGPARGRAVGDVGWSGGELVGFRMHLPSKIPFHNSPGSIQRGNILAWEQPLSERMKGTPLDLRVQMETESILFRTLLLFGSTMVAALAALALAIWWVVRRGRKAALAESQP